MRLEEMEKHYSRKYGIIIYQQSDPKDGRKRYYKINYPVFDDNRELPVSSKDYIVKTPAEAKKYIDSVLLSNEKYKKQCEQWITNH